MPSCLPITTDEQVVHSMTPRRAPAASGPTEAAGNRSSVDGLGQPGVVVELRRQVPSERAVRLHRLGHAECPPLGRDRHLDGVQCGELAIRAGTEPDPTNADLG